VGRILIMMSITGLTPEQRRLVEQAGDLPVRIEDPAMRQSYVLIRADVYERVRDVIEPRSYEELHVPEGVRKSQEAFFRDLPELLNDRKLKGRYVAYHGNERIGIAMDDVPLIRECLRRGLNRDEYDVLIIEPQSREPEEIDYPSCWEEE
jgi:hypothetical protein